MVRLPHAFIDRPETGDARYAAVQLPLKCQVVIGILALAMTASCGLSSPSDALTKMPTASAWPTETPSTRMPTAEADIPTASPPTGTRPTPVARLLPRERQSVAAALEDWSDLRGQEVLLILSTDSTLPDGGEVTLDYMTWHGNRGTLTSFRLPPGGAIQGEPMTGYGRAVMVAFLPQDSWAQETYVIDFQAGMLWAFEDACELTSYMSIGPELLSFSCSGAWLVWHFVSLDDPSKQMTHDLYGEVDLETSFYPLWVDATRILLLKHFGLGACSGDVTAWEPTCKQFGREYWLGPISPDGFWFEVRSWDELHPSQIGIARLKCLFEQETPCIPRLLDIPPDVAPLGLDRFLGDSAWLPDSSGLLYAIHVGVDQETLRAERTEIWRHDLTSKGFEKLYEFRGELYFGDPRFEHSPAPWSPDGRYVAMKEIGGGIYKLEVETGELTLLSEGGVLLGSVHLE